MRRDPHDGERIPTEAREPWPEPLREAAHHGPVGDFVRALAGETEADLSALLVVTLASLGNLFADRLVTRVDGARHRPILFVVVVGETARARKSTALRQARSLLEKVDGTVEERSLSGIGSGEVLVDSVRDPAPDRDDPGVTDKRRIWREDEFGAVLTRMGRDGSTLSTYLRQLWDGDTLRAVSRQRSSVATEPLVTLLAAITRAELDRKLSDTDVFNGVGNRMLWVPARRGAVIPEGRSTSVDARVVHELREAVVKARATSGPLELRWSHRARPIWDRHYREFAERKRSGLYDAVTARAEAQVLRLAMVYAGLDSSLEIEPAHLEAALEVWRFCDDGAGVLFGGRSGDPDLDRLRAALARAPEGLDKTDVHHLFARNRKKEQIEALLVRAAAGGVAVATAGTGAKKGRTVWRATK